jgi:hypothetical protein
MPTKEDAQRALDEALALAGKARTGAAKPSATGKQEGKRLVAHLASDINPAAVEWLWPGRIAIGKTTLIGGDPGLGKSQLAAFIAATMSRGGQWPCGEGGAPQTWRSRWTSFFAWCRDAISGHSSTRGPCSAVARTGSRARAHQQASRRRSANLI